MPGLVKRYIRYSLVSIINTFSLNAASITSSTIGLLVSSILRASVVEQTIYF
jgi:hypothetical protein